MIAKKHLWHKIIFIFRDASLNIDIMQEDCHVVYYGMYSVVGGHTVVQLVEALHYELAGHGFDSQWCHWNFSLT